MPTINYVFFLTDSGYSNQRHLHPNPSWIFLRCLINYINTHLREKFIKPFQTQKHSLKNNNLLTHFHYHIQTNQKKKPSSSSYFTYRIPSNLKQNIKSTTTPTQNTFKNKRIADVVDNAIKMSKKNSTEAIDLPRQIRSSPLHGDPDFKKSTHFKTNTHSPETAGSGGEAAVDRSSYRPRGGDGGIDRRTATMRLNASNQRSGCVRASCRGATLPLSASNRVGRLRPPAEG